MWTVTYYMGWDEINVTLPSYDAAMTFIEDTGMDPDEFDVIEDADDEPILRHPTSYGWWGHCVIDRKSVV